MNGRVLVVDDEKEIRDLIVRYLKRELFDAVPAPDGERAVQLATAEPFDLIILDIMMPGKDGFQVLTELRAGGIDTPILFLTAKHDDASVIQGLGMGADEYVTKPFSPAVLTARVQALLRLHARGRDSGAGTPGRNREVMEAGPFQLDAKKCEVRKHEQPVQLSAMEYRILKFFLEHPDQVFTRDQLYGNCWEDAYHDDNTIVVYIRRLREKIEADPSKPVHLLTMRGLGYCFSPGGDA